MQWFRQLEGHEYLLPVSRNFLEDKFNLLHLSQLKLSKDRMEKCQALMFRQYAPTDEEMQSESFLSLNQDTSDLYGLIHARYIRSPEGKLLVKPCFRRAPAAERATLIICLIRLGLALVYGNYL